VAGDHLRVFTPDLLPLGEVELPLKESWAGKVAHDLVVHDGVAYLIDDVVSPLYVVRVDVRDPSAMVVLERREVFGGHLPGHWLEPDAGRWMVLETWGGRGGSHLAVHALPMRGGGEIESLTLSRTSFDFLGGGNRSTEGLSIVAVTGTSPAWAVVAGEEGARVGRVRVAGDMATASLCDAGLDLGAAPEDAPYPAAGVDRADGFVVGFWGSTVFAIDVGVSPPALVAMQPIEGRVEALRAYG
ncbi:MAG TPA: hypothetical protein VHH36_06750, partial [Candidatus Thermoplasmatota archaeon]|nr:hypothetical protein [Candidatus Thermoplasmatota archaeon]